MGGERTEECMEQSDVRCVRAKFQRHARSDEALHYFLAVVDPVLA